MSNSTSTSNRYAAAVALRNAQHADDVLTFDAAATLLGGTILGRAAVSGKLKSWAADATDGSQTPRAVLTADVVALAAGDVAARVLVAGDVDRGRLVIAADGNGDNITAALLDQLRARGITAIDVQGVGSAAQ